MIFAYMAFLHFLADFAFQWRDMAKRKTEDHVVLSHHCMIVYAVFTVGLLAVLTPEQAILIGVINAVSHVIIDWNIWKWYKYSVCWRNRETPPAELQDTWEYWKDYWFFFNIGLEQFLHMLVLFATYYMVT